MSCQLFCLVDIKKTTCLNRFMMSDAELIELYGGAKKLAARLGYANAGGFQRVHNWITRGIPARVKLEHPKLFLKKPRKKAV